MDQGHDDDEYFGSLNIIVIGRRPWFVVSSIHITSLLLVHAIAASHHISLPRLRYLGRVPLQLPKILRPDSTSSANPATQPDPALL